jgi:hypothetical protein
LKKVVLTRSRRDRKANNIQAKSSSKYIGTQKAGLNYWSTQTGMGSGGRGCRVGGVQAMQDLRVGLWGATNNHPIPCSTPSIASTFLNAPATQCLKAASGHSSCLGFMQGDQSSR